MTTAPTKPWPIDAVIIIASRRGTEVRARMTDPAVEECRDCGVEVVVDTPSVSAAAAYPQRNGRPIAYLCIECAVTYNRGSVDHVIGLRPGA